MVISTNYDDDDDEVKWVTHYSSNHRILLVGDGDFSFSLCLARSFGSASNIVSTSLDSHDEVMKKYKKAKSNLSELHNLGARILHGVDATKMKFHPDLMNRRFDRIVFNFPHAGFRGRECDTRVIASHRILVRGFFSNAKSMVLPEGEVHVSHKTTGPFSDWNLEGLAWSNSLVLVERAKFKIEDYPMYEHKRGDGPRCDRPFRFGESSTFKFRLSPTLEIMHRRRSHPDQFQAARRPPNYKLDLMDYPMPRVIRRGGERIMLPEFERSHCLNPDIHFLPEFSRRLFHPTDFDVNEQASFGFYRNARIAYPGMAMNRDTRLWHEMDRITHHDVFSPVNDNRFGLNVGTAMIARLEHERNVQPDLGLLRRLGR